MSNQNDSADLILANLAIHAIQASGEYDLLDRLSAVEMLKSSHDDVRRYGLASLYYRNTLTPQQCFTIIYDDHSVELVAAAFRYLSDLKMTEDERCSVINLCRILLQDANKNEAIRVAAYKCLLYLLNRVALTDKLVFEITSLNDIEWDIISDFIVQ